VDEEAALLLVRRFFVIASAAKQSRAAQTALDCFAALAMTIGLIALFGCGQPTSRVDPAQHDAFFLWAGVKSPAVLAQAKTVYLLAGEVRRDGSYAPLRATPQVRKAEVWLVIRAARINWSPAVEARVLAELDRWAASNRLAGLQVDFDASTRKLDLYASFLSALRKKLPAKYKLSVTGLMDWSANADPAALAQLRGVVDEVVVQSYQGRETIPGYEQYLARLARVPVPHKVALIEGGEWREPEALRSDPGFRGYVVFLRNAD
jgi:hypothetical protein